MNKEVPKIEKTRLKKDGVNISPGTIFGAYLIVGFIVASIQITIWQWDILSFFSPNFYWIVITWPLYITGLAATILNWVWTYIIGGIF